MKSKKSKLLRAELVHFAHKGNTWNDRKSVTATIKLFQSTAYGEADYCIDVEYCTAYVNRAEDMYVNVGICQRLNDLENWFPIIKHFLTALEKSSSDTLTGKIRNFCPIIDLKEQSARKQMVEASKEASLAEMRARAEQLASFLDLQLSDKPAPLAIESTDENQEQEEAA